MSGSLCPRLPAPPTPTAALSVWLRPIGESSRLLPLVIDYFLSGVLAPAVVVSSDVDAAAPLVESLFAALPSCLGDSVKMIRAVDPLVVKVGLQPYNTSHYTIPTP